MHLIPHDLFPGSTFHACSIPDFFLVSTAFFLPFLDCIVNFYFAHVHGFLSRPKYFPFLPICELSWEFQFLISFKQFQVTPTKRDRDAKDYARLYLVIYAGSRTGICGCQDLAENLTQTKFSRYSVSITETRPHMQQDTCCRIKILYLSSICFFYRSTKSLSRVQHALALKRANHNEKPDFYASVMQKNKYLTRHLQKHSLDFLLNAFLIMKLYLILKSRGLAIMFERVASITVPSCFTYVS